jgi:hypothetical protein
MGSVVINILESQMRKIIAGVAAVVAIVTTIITSTVFWDTAFSSENKINHAVPVSEKVRINKTAAFETSTHSEWKDIEAELETRLKIRALRCAKGYSPSFYESSENVKKNLGDQSCFSEVDSEIAQWLGIRRVGLILAKPALKPVPTIAPSFIVADATILNAEFADNAGIALLETSQEFQIIDVNSQKPLFREAKGASVIGSISANGRLFATGDGDLLKIRDAESGVVITELSGIHMNEFHWLDESSALYNKINSDKTFIIDFSAGKEIPVQAINKNVTRVVRMPQTTNQFAAFSEKGMTRIELVRDQTGLQTKLLDDKNIPGFSGDLNASGVTADGIHYFNLGRQLTVLSLNTLASQTTSLDSFHAQFAVATPDPDKILLTAPSQSSGEAGRSLLYSISKKALIPVDRNRITGERYLYASTLKRQAVITDNKIALIEAIPGPKSSVPAKTPDAPTSDNQPKPAEQTPPTPSTQEPAPPVQLTPPLRLTPPVPSAQPPQSPTSQQPAQTQQEGESQPDPMLTPSKKSKASPTT